METEPESKLITKSRLGQRYTVSVRTVDNWMKNRVVPYHKLGPKCVRFDPIECDAALARRFKIKVQSLK